MTSIRRNIVANALGGVWIVALNLLVIPVQFRILGSEAYGMLAILAVMQLIFSVLDLGAAATLVQRIASDTTPQRRATHELFGTALAVFGTIALAAALLLAGNVTWLAGDWFRSSGLPAQVTSDSLLLIIFAALLRCPTLLCSATISGLNRLDIFNLLRAATQSLRQFGGIAVLLIRGDLVSLLWWEVAVSALEACIFFAACRRLVPGLSPLPRLSRRVVDDCWRYALGMNATFLLALLLTQTDKLAISRWLPLESLGIYHLAFSLTAWLALIQGGFNSAILPSLAADAGAGHIAQLRLRHNKITRLTVYAVTLPAMAIVFFAAEMLALWVEPATAQIAAAVAAPLAAGFLLNAAVSNCLSVAVASGNSALPLRINLAGLVLYLPVLAVLLQTFGIAGAAWAWVVLNVYYLLVMAPIVQYKLLAQPFSGWLAQIFLPHIAAGAAAFACAKLLLLAWPNSGTALVCALTLAGAVYALAGYRLLGVELRMQIAGYAQALLLAARRA